MRQIIFVLIMTLGLPAGGTLQAQTTGAVLAQYSAIEESVVRIRTVADLEYTEVHPVTGETVARTRPYSVDGTGVVVGKAFVDGFLEYLILTNHHVAVAGNYVLVENGYARMNPTNTLATPSRRKESYLMKVATDSVTDADVQLVEVVQIVRGDMALMRTVGANRELTVFDGALGYVDGEVGPGDPIVISGYPLAGPRVVETGSIVEESHRHGLGLPHDDLVIDIPVEPGQSGGPVFLVEGDGAGEITFRLIGLVHARDLERTYAVSYRLWDRVLDEFPAELQERLVR